MMHLLSRPISPIGVSEMDAIVNEKRGTRKDVPCLYHQSTLTLLAKICKNCQNCMKTTKNVGQ